MEANKNQVEAYTYTLRGHDNGLYIFPKIVYEPSHCQPREIVKTFDPTVSEWAVGGPDAASANPGSNLMDLAADDYFDWEDFVDINTYAASVGVSKNMPLDKAGKYVWTITGKTSEGDVPIDADGA